MHAKKATAAEIQKLVAHLAGDAPPDEWSPRLMNAFNEDVWNLSFGELIFSLDFRIPLSTGDLLTSPSCHTLARDIKRWILRVCNADTSRSIYSWRTVRHRVGRAIHCIDWILLNVDHRRLSAGSLEAITESEWKGLIASLANTGDSEEGIYRWSWTLREFLRAESAGFDPHSIASDFPGILDIPTDRTEFRLNLSDGELIAARAYLALNGLTRTTTEWHFRNVPNTLRLASRLYPATLLGCRRKMTIPPELCFDPIFRVSNEYPASEVRSGNRCAQWVHEYQSAIRLSNPPERRLASSPCPSYNEAVSAGFIDQFSLPPAGRFKTLPFDVTSQLIRSCIEFFFERGDSIRDAYLHLLKIKTTFEGKTVYGGLSQYLSSEARAQGIYHWHLARPGVTITETDRKCEEARRRFFTALRSGEGLYELISVLYGAVLIVVGAITARRQSELSGFTDRSLPNIERNFIETPQRKRGAGDLGAFHRIPIPSLVRRMMIFMINLQREALSITGGPVPRSIFAPPHSRLLRLNHGCTPQGYRECVDTACDYFSVPLDKDGRRYYVRQHQLRRFFAMSFFWGARDGNLDTLRSFLGHSNPIHVYRYITETLPGAVLADVRVAYAVEQLIEGSLSSEHLKMTVLEHFSEADINVISQNELTAYVEYLQQSGGLDVEPEFFEDESGHSYRILIKVCRTP